MFRDFEHYTAWTDAMREGQRCVGLIEFQPKVSRADARVLWVLWVLSPRCIGEREAQTAADNMLEQIRDITLDGRVIYRDGVSL